MDPAKDGLNWYVYVNNNPLKYVDPDGHSATLALLLGGVSLANFYVSNASVINQLIVDFYNIGNNLPMLKEGTKNTVDVIKDKLGRGGESGNPDPNELKRFTKRDELLNQAQNSKLKNAINEIYRPNANVGDGGLVDAIRHQSKTGELVGGRDHIQKGYDYMRNLQNIIRRQHLSPGDLKIAQDLLSDLQQALEVSK